VGGCISFAAYWRPVLLEHLDDLNPRSPLLIKTSSVIARTDFRQQIVFGDYYPASSVGTFSHTVQIIDPVNAANNVARLYTATNADAIVEAALDAGDAIDAALAARLQRVRLGSTLFRVEHLQISCGRRREHGRLPFRDLAVGFAEIPADGRAFTLPGFHP